jgi:hypothetical protein
MDGVTQLAVPVALVLFLTNAFDYGKSLLVNVPGFRQSDEQHSRNLQLVFFALCLLTISVWSYGFGGAHPVDTNGWLHWVEQVVTTAIGMAFGGAFTYAKLSGGSSSASAPATDPTQTQNGLPLNMGG